MAQTVKILPAVQEARVQSLGQEDPLEKEMNICVHVYIILDALVYRSNMIEDP